MAVHRNFIGIVLNKIRHKNYELRNDEIEDLLELNQKEAAKKMNVSQSTFYRIKASAKKKIADVLINGKIIKIEGGDFKISKRKSKK